MNRPRQIRAKLGRVGPTRELSAGDVSGRISAPSARSFLRNAPLFPGYSGVVRVGPARNPFVYSVCFVGSPPSASPAFSRRPSLSRRRSAEAAFPRCRLWRHPISGPISCLENRPPAACPRYRPLGKLPSNPLYFRAISGSSAAIRANFLKAPRSHAHDSPRAGMSLLARFFRPTVSFIPASSMRPVPPRHPASPLTGRGLPACCLPSLP